IVATAFGVAASLGIGALQINSGLNRVAGMPVGAPWQIGIIIVATLLFVVSAVSGVDRGVKWLSSANLVLAAALALVVALLGPTVVLVDTFTTTLGAYLSEFVQMSLRTTPFRDNTWVGSWTVFYWAWWISWSPFVGMFIARVSRGRTIREFVLGTVLAPAIAGALWFSIFGGCALWLEIFGQAPLAEAAKTDVATVLFVMFDHLPMAGLLSGVATLLVLVFFVTSGDSATLVLAIMSEDGEPNPRTRVKAIWGALIAGIAISLLLSGGVKAIQTATIVFALPFALVIVLMAVALVRGVREDWRVVDERERALHKRLRDMTGK
ncbi:MAG TPA: BCCT family transporter, partial [Rhizobacter sp.]|nr:BCCT family transporter [Rhizobacter sp.]